jgi:ubiquinone/menaquinone biosynthesis C-methylase UbiE
MSSELKPGTSEYEKHKREEIQHYATVFTEEKANGQCGKDTLFQPTPESWVEMERRTAALSRHKTGNSMRDHLLTRFERKPGLRMVSLGSGPGGIELWVARQVRQAQILCMDFNPILLAMGAGKSQAEGLLVRFQEADLNTVTLPENEFDIVFCHASLHHVIELERLMEQIKTTLKPGGELIIVDVVTRTGYLMWPETREVVDAIWKTLPKELCINHTGYAEPWFDESIWEMDTSQTGMECIRSGEILPLLAAHFTARHYVPYLSICRRFFDNMYGPNYDLQNPLHSAILNWIWELDRYYIESGRLKPESFFGIYTL